MSGYNYQEQKKNLFTENGIKDFLAIRDQVKKQLKETGAFTFSGLHVSGDEWFNQAVLDFMIESGELVKLRGEESAWMQFWVYATPQTDNR